MWDLVSARTGALRTGAVWSQWWLVVSTGRGGVGRIEFVVRFVPMIFTVCL